MESTEELAYAVAAQTTEDLGELLGKPRALRREAEKTRGNRLSRREILEEQD